MPAGYVAEIAHDAHMAGGTAFRRCRCGDWQAGMGDTEPPTRRGRADFLTVWPCPGGNSTRYL